MGITVYGRRAQRRIEAATGEKIVHAAGPWSTTVNHMHLEWRPELQMWMPLNWADGFVDCGVPLASCRTLFGRDDAGRPTWHFMLGRCDLCRVGLAEPHRWNCPNLLTAMAMTNPDYWPRPVHRPLWMDHRAGSDVLPDEADL